MKKAIKKQFYLSICLMLSLAGQSQNIEIPLGMNTYHILDRLEIKTGIFPSFHSSLKAHFREDIKNYAYQLDTSSILLTLKDRRDLEYLLKDNNRWNENTIHSNSFLKHFYKTTANLWELQKNKFHLIVNPILNLKFAKTNNDQFIFSNQKGISIRGAINKKIFFSASVLESRNRFADYVRDRIGNTNAIPGAGSYKTTKSKFFDLEHVNTFLLAQGYIGFNISKHISFQLGHGKNFIGNGYRSLILSDFSNNYFYQKISVSVWKFHYQTLFTKLSPYGAITPGNISIPKKYTAMHHLSFNLLKNLNIGIFEAVVYNRSNNFELQYLNPVIFYRTIEQSLGSPDNALIGLDFKWNLLKRFQIYGQLMLDEFKFDELITDRRGWWANKYGLQFGIKYMDVFGMDHLDAQAEFNLIRPYTYTHRSGAASYTHYNQPLAHPLGANFKEFIFKLRYQPTQKLTFNPKIIIAKYGEDSDSTNWGTNLLLSHNTREQSINNTIGQGIATDLLIFGVDINYQLYHNFFLDFEYFYRKKNSTIDSRDQETSYFGGGVRWNFARKQLDF